MAKPHASKVRHSFELGSPHRFNLEGQYFDTATKVHLVDTASDVAWDPELVTTFTEQTATRLRFTSTPKSRSGRTKKSGPRPVGQLTITVTNPDGDDATPPSVDTSYQ